jgi:four helix bundle protein
VLVLVLDLKSQPADNGRMHEHPCFDHEKLDVYRLAVEFLGWVGELLDGPLAGSRCAAAKHLDEASQSIANNIAEGNGKRSLADRSRYLDIARGSALECAACLDGLVARRKIAADRAAAGKGMLLRIVSMLTKLLERLLGSAALGSTVSSTSTSTSTK